jgi:signal transduction histidine kinase
MNDFSYYDHLFDPVLVINLKREIIYFNHQSSVFFKLPPRLLKQKNNILQLCDSPDIDIENWLGSGLLSFDNLVTPEIRLYTPHEPSIEYYCIIKLVPIQTTSGANFAVFFHDMTVEKKLHAKYRQQLEELKKTHTQILQADKLSTLGELTANISHEINNPLTIAAGHSEIIQDLLKSKDVMTRIPRLQSANEAVVDALERVNQIIKNMKDFLHQSEDEKEYCDLNVIIDTAIEWIIPSAHKNGITIQKEATGPKLAVLANRIKLEQVIINIIKNSIEAIQEAQIPDGKITLTYSKSEHKETIIDILDNGPGISAQTQEQLFKPFMSTKDAGSGTGLGLSICSKIIEAHQGKLEFIPSKQGCHFRIRMPLIEIYSFTRNDKSLSGSETQKRILVLDNEVQILNVLNTFFHEEGIVFIGSSNPHDAIDFLQKADIDLIMTDFSMPHMSGSEFARLARSQGFHGPILYMTSVKNIEQYNKDKAELNISGLVLKPFSKEDVLKTIGLALPSHKGEVHDT